MQQLLITPTATMAQVVPSAPAVARRSARAIRVLPIGDEVQQAPHEVPLADEGFTREEAVSISVYEKTNRSVVNITTRTVRPDQFFAAQVPSEGTGSGAVLDRDGRILTNYHVVEDAQQISVTLFDGTSYEATAVGADPLNDIAVLKIDAPAEILHPVTISSDRRLRVGQRAYAIGNPFGFERTMTEGIISSLNRQLPARNGRTMKSLIQIDAALNRGNSGGPLLDSRGQLIGMNTAIASESGENTGVGFAIPATSLQRIVPQLVANGRIVRPDLGITRVQETENGVLIASLLEGGAAERAGLRGFRFVRQQQQRGAFVYERTVVDRDHADMIVAIDGVPVRTVDDLLTETEKHQPGEEVAVSFLRQGKSVEKSIALDPERE
ncbi:MAG: trypsin-like peptidase domain-containing protein [Planctomycetota bacterium]|nr:trypsin-like peptidase domain-containing protein [Planctomycetota bacterium]